MAIRKKIAIFYIIPKYHNIQFKAIFKPSGRIKCHLWATIPPQQN